MLLLEVGPAQELDGEQAILTVRWETGGKPTEPDMAYLVGGTPANRLCMALMHVLRKACEEDNETVTRILGLNTPNQNGLELLNAWLRQVCGRWLLFTGGDAGQRWPVLCCTGESDEDDTLA